MLKLLPGKVIEKGAEKVEKKKKPEVKSCSLEFKPISNYKRSHDSPSSPSTVTGRKVISKRTGTIHFQFLRHFTNGI